MLSLQVFNSLSVTVMSLLFLTVAVFRLRNTILHESFFWNKTQGLVYVLNALILLPYLIKLGTHGFDRGDEIYSWNFWAIQHFFQESIDFSHTGAPYPQLFPKLLALGYQLLGNIELQLPLKATLIIFPYCMLTAIGVCALRHRPDWAKYLLGLFYVMVLVGLEQFFDDGYADPLMSSCLITSLALFWISQEEKDIKEQKKLNLYLFWSVCCAIACAHAKQAGLLYTMFALPVLILANAKQDKKFYYAMAMLSFLGGLIWVSGEGQQFHTNKGVIWLSSGNRDSLSQLWHAIDKYFIHKPFLCLLFLVSGFYAFKHRLLKILFIAFILPATICWFLFGAYQLRLGQHIIAVAFFVVMVSIPWPLRWPSFLMKKRLRIKPVLVGAGVFSIVMSGIVFTQEYWIHNGNVSIYQGGRQSLTRYFGQDTQKVYDQIYKNKDALLWVPSRYLYGLFYHHTQLTTPDYLQTGKYDAKALITELQKKGPDFVFTVSKDVIDGPASEVLSAVIHACPNAFEIVADAPNRFSFMTYRVDKAMLLQDDCLKQLAS